MPKYFLLVFASLLFYTAESQNTTPTYKEVVEKEILSNSIENTDENLQKPYVVMVSIDGFRFDYAEKYKAENILAIAKNGSIITRLIPSFPSKTFPNHYSLVTGLYPEHHGIVSNSFYDKRAQKGYSIGDRNAVEDGSWYGGIPLWNLAQKQGMCAASYFWVGSEANINGMYPKYYYTYNAKTPYEYRVKRALEWLQLPEKVRPHYITLYFSAVDDNGHNFGHDAPETAAAVSLVDKQIGDLREGLRHLNIPVYLIITSDHGMENVSKEINIHDFVQLDKKQFFSGPVAMVYTQSEQETNKIYNLLSNQSLFKIYRRSEVPTYLHYSQNEKIGDLVLITDPPYNIIYSETIKEQTIGGTHGYDPFENKNMGAIFYIEGPGIKKGYKHYPIENIHVYPLVAHLLGLKLIDSVDGKLEAISSVLENK